MMAHYPRGVEAPPETVMSFQLPADVPFFRCPTCRMGFLRMEQYGIPLPQVAFNQLGNRIEQRHTGWLVCCQDNWFRWNEKSD